VPVAVDHYQTQRFHSDYASERFGSYGILQNQDVGMMSLDDVKQIVGLAGVRHHGHVGLGLDQATKRLG
jgi:hypothetical protein